MSLLVSNKKTHLDCPICKYKAFFIFNSKNNIAIFKCSNNHCSHFFTPIIKENQGVCDRPEDIDHESNKDLKIYEERNVRLLDLFIKTLPHSSYPFIFLDYGSGNANISRTFKSILGNRCIIYCVEPNPLCEGLYKKYGLEHVQNINSVNKKIDLIYLTEVIEHLDDPIKSLKELRSVLKPNGKIFIATPIGKNNESRTMAYDTPSHVHFFTEKSLNLTLVKAGFSNLEVKHYSEYYPLPKNSVIKKIKYFIKSFLRKTIIGSGLRIGIGHMAGFSKPK